MAPQTVKTYGKKKTRKKDDKEDTFDKLFRPSVANTKIFESSSERENSATASSSASFLTAGHSSGIVLSKCDVLDVSDLSPGISILNKIKPNLSKKNQRVEKKRSSSRNKRSALSLKGSIRAGLDKQCFLASSTPLSLRPIINTSNTVDKNVSPIEAAQAIPNLSPKISKFEALRPKNILSPQPSQVYDSANSQLFSLAEEDFLGFPSLSIRNFFNIQLETQKTISMYKDRVTAEKVGISTISERALSLQSSKGLTLGHLTEECLSRSMQNLNISSEKDHKKIVKSSSFDESKACRVIDKPADINVDSSDIEESVVNSADERSCSIRSGQLDEEESAFHSSDEENTSGFSKDKDLNDSGNHKSISKGDSESAIFSATHKDTSFTNQSGEVSADDCELYLESEITKSSDSIEVSRTANIENISSDISTSSDKEILRDEDIGTTITLTFPLEMTTGLKQSITYQQSKNCSKRSKDSYYSLENSASDESELSLESDSELSCESSRSSRKSSLESASNISKESLEQLRECVSRMSVGDHYENARRGKCRKSVGKRRGGGGGSEWECPPSPRRSLFPLTPLFPLPENQEDSGTGGDGGQSTTASEDDSHHSAPRRSSKARGEKELEPDTRSSGEDESTKSSPVRETARLRRSRRLSKRKESNCRLNMVVEESDSESAEVDVPQMEHIYLPIGKKYRRSLSIIKHLVEDPGELPPTKGRHYDESVEAVIKLQSRTGFESPRAGRKSLLIKRKSLLSQCYTPCDSPASGASRMSMDFLASILESSPTISRLSFRRLSCSVREDINRTRLPFRRDILLEEEEEDDSEVADVPEEVDRQESGDISIVSDSSVTTDSTAPSLHFDYKSIVMKCCQQSEPVSFSTILPANNWVEEATKVGEGVYGEVFLMPRDNVKNVIKIIPIEGSLKVNNEKQKTYAEISNELLVAVALSELRLETDEYMTSGFAELVEASVVKGRYPKKLIDLWNAFNETKGSDNDSPTIFNRDQLYLVLELGNAGQDLEGYSFSTAKQGLSVFKQTVCALAVAEAYYEFEHRDLHWGNVLVSRTSERQIPFILNKETYEVLTHGVKATIIDFTLSRMTFSTFPVFCNIGQDPDMFIGTGDYQFDVYRCMKEDVQDSWSSFVPKTNVRWLHYLVDKMISKVRYQRKTAKVHTDSMKVLRDIESWILSCNSSVEVAQRVLKYK